MTERTRGVIIDDRDSRIRFTGNWVAANGDAYNSRGRHGPVYRNTLQGSTTDGAKLTFSFSGTKAEILGTTDPGSTDASLNWDCVLDGRVDSTAKGASSQPGDGPINQWPFCIFSDLIPGRHTIELVVRTEGRTFWFDNIQYAPTDVVSGETIDVGQDDQDIKYSSGWESYRGIAFITRQAGSTVTVPFSGTGITLLGNYHTDFSSIPSDATYTIDGGEPVSFTIQGGGSSDDYNRRLLEVLGLPSGIHTLVVQHQGNDRTMPLMVDRLFIEGGTNRRTDLASSGGNGGITQIPTNTTPSSSATPSTESVTPPNTTGNPSATPLPSSGQAISPTQSSDPTVMHDPLETGDGSSASRSEGNNPHSNSTNTPTAAIAIGVTLGVLALVLLFLFLFWIRRRRRHIRSSSQLGDSTAHFFDHEANVQSERPQVDTQPAPSMSTLSGIALSYAAATHPEARSKLRVLAPPSAPAMSFDGGLGTTFSDSSSGYTQSAVPPSSVSGHQASISTSSGPNAAIAVLQHQDSGVRLANREQMQTVEVPPLYSAQ